MANAVDVGGVEVEALACMVLPRPLAHPTVLLDPEPVFEKHALADAYGSGRAVVIVVAGALSVDPADEPDIEARVAVQLLIEPGTVIVVDKRAPQSVRLPLPNTR